MPDVTPAQVNTTASTGVDYVLYQDAGTVYLRNRRADSVTGYGSDWSAAIRAVIGASDFLSTGANVLVSRLGGRLPAPPSSSAGPVALPPSMAGWLRVEGETKTAGFTCSGYCPRVFDPGKTADYQTFQKISFKRFSVDGNGVNKLATGYGSNAPGGSPNNGVDHVLFGGRMWGTLVTRISGKDIECEDVVFTGNLYDPDSGLVNGLRLCLWLLSGEDDYHAGNPLSMTRIRIRDNIFDGQDGWSIGYGRTDATKPDWGKLNAVIDDFHVSGNHWDSGGVYNTGLANASGLGDLGDFARVLNGVIEGETCDGAGDTGIGIAGVEGEVIVRECVMRNSRINGFNTSWQRQNGSPRKGALRFIDCHAEQTVAGMIGSGWLFNLGSANIGGVSTPSQGGGVYLERCSSSHQTTDIIGVPLPDIAFNVSKKPRLRAFVCRKFRVIYEGGDYSAVGALSPNYSIQLYNDVSAVVEEFELDVDFSIQGTVEGGSGGYSAAFPLVFMSGGTVWDPKIRARTSEVTLTGIAANRIRLIELGGGGLSLALKGVAELTPIAGPTFSGDTTPRGIRLRGSSLLTADKINIGRDSSFAGFPVGGVDVELVNDTGTQPTPHLLPGAFMQAGKLARNGGLFTSTPGAVTTVTIAHGVWTPATGTAPRSFSVQPADANANAAPDFYVTADGTNITLTFFAALDAARAYSWQWMAIA